MSELRLVPAALCVWLTAALVILTRNPVVLMWLLLPVLAMVALKHYGQALFVGLASFAAGVVSWARVWGVDKHPYSQQDWADIRGKVVGDPKLLESGAWLLRVKDESYPEAISIVVRSSERGGESIEVPEAGAHISLAARLMPSDREGLVPVFGSARDVELLEEPAGAAAWANHIADTFRAAVQEAVGPSSEGLIPGMVLGDVSLQSPSEAELYRITGLAHLSAVSGANIAIVTASIVLLLRWLSFGPRVQVGGGAIALLLYVLLVGYEPSVLRASVAGIVGMIAIVGSANHEPIHALCLGVLLLLIIQPGLAVDYGFALSVAATAGIVALFPLFYRIVASTRVPDVVARIVAVSIAADLVTMPIIAAMSGRISLISIAANVLVAPAVPAVTILGMLAVLLALLPCGLEWLPLKLIEPLTWWIHTIARVLGERSLVAIDLPNGHLGWAWTVLALAWCGWGTVTLIRAGESTRRVVGLASLVVAMAFVAWSGINHLRTGINAPSVSDAVCDAESVLYLDRIDKTALERDDICAIIVRDKHGISSSRPTVNHRGVPIFHQTH